MDLNALHSLMNRKKYYYFDGKTNDIDNNLYLSFSTVYNCRGNVVEIRIGNIDNDIVYLNGSTTSKFNVNDNEIFSFIENNC